MMVIIQWIYYTILMVIDSMYQESPVLFPSTKSSILTIDTETPDSRTKRISLCEIMFATIAKQEKSFYLLVLFEYISPLHVCMRVWKFQYLYDMNMSHSLCIQIFSARSIHSRSIPNTDMMGNLMCLHLMEINIRIHKNFHHTIKCLKMCRKICSHGLLQCKGCHMEM